MKKFRISSPLNLHYASRENANEYIRQGLLFHKEMGFDAADFATGLLDLTSDAWKDMSALCTVRFCLFSGRNKAALPDHQL